MSTEQMSAQQGSYPETERFSFTDLEAMAPPSAEPASLTDEEQALELELIAKLQGDRELLTLVQGITSAPSLSALVLYGERRGGFIRLVSLIGRSQSSHPMMAALRAQLDELVKDPTALAARLLMMAEAKEQAQFELDQQNQNALRLVEDLMLQGQVHAGQMAAETFGFKFVVMPR